MEIRIFSIRFAFNKSQERLLSLGKAKENLIEPNCRAENLKFQGRLFQRSLASVQQNCVLSHFHFAERFYVNTIFREEFH